MSKRNIRAKSGKQLYLNSSFNRGMVYTSSEIPEGYTKLLNNFDITPSGDAISPRAPFKEIKHKVKGLSKYTYPINFQQLPDKQFYINFPNTVSEYNYAHDVINNENYSNKANDYPVYLFSRDVNMLNNLSIGFDEVYDNSYNKNNTVTVSIDFRRAPVPIIISEKIYNESEKQCPVINVPVVNYSRTGLPPDTITTYYVTDADTLFINNVEYRLINVNSPEMNHKWYEYGKSVLNQIMESAKSNNRRFYAHEYNTDIYNRTVADILIEVGVDNWLSLSQVVVRLGLAKIHYVDESYEYMKQLQQAEAYAIRDNLRIWNIHGVDIKYDGFPTDIVFTNVEEGEYVLEAVRLTSDKQINYNTTNVIDMVDYTYVDYNDSIAFIGRVLKVDDEVSVYYKGILYLKYNSEFGQFQIELPPNNLNGELVSVIDTVSNGYNLLNKDVIDTNDYVDPSLPLSCDGIAITLSDDPTTLVQQAKSGMSVSLRAIMNKSWYSIPEVDLELPYQATISFNVKYNINGVEQYITENSKNLKDGELTRFIYDQTTDDITNVRIILNGINVTFNYLDKEYTSGYSLDRLEIPLNETTPTLFNIKNEVSTLNGTIEFSLKLDRGSAMINTKIEDPLLIKADTKDLEIQGQWEVSPYNSESFNIIQPYTKLCSITGLVPTDWSGANTLKYNVTNSNSLTFRFSYRVNYKLVLDRHYINISLPHTSIVYPLLSVGDMADFINHEELTNNLNIQDATRLGVFNRQVYVYGPYLKTNTIFFSKFENPWYFSYPFYAIDTEDRIIHAVVWNSNLTIFQKNSIWVLVTEGTVNESSLHKVYDELSILDIDKRLVKTVGSNLIFFNSNNGYIMTSSKYYDDPTNVNVYKFTDNINNCLADPNYIFRTVRNIPINVPVNHIYCEYFLYIDNDYINLVSYLKSNNRSDQYSSTIIYRYNQLYKYWTTYSVNKYLTTAYTTEPNINNQYVSYDGTQFGIVYQDNGDISREEVDCVLDTGFLAIDPLNDKRFKDVIIDFNNIINCKKQTGLDRNIINIYNNFFIDGVPITLSDNNPAIEFEYENLNYPGSIPVFDEGNYNFQFVDDVDVHNDHDLPFGYIISNWSEINDCPDTNADNDTDKYIPNIVMSDYDIKVQGRSQIRIPVFGKGRLPSMAIKVVSKYPYEIVGYSIIYKEKNINRRR
jgi:hypothetical protein